MGRLSAVRTPSIWAVSMGWVAVINSSDDGRVNASGYLWASGGQKSQPLDSIYFSEISVGVSGKTRHTIRGTSRGTETTSIRK